MGSKSPVNIRRNVQSFGDPYIDRHSLEETTVCKRCASVYTSGRWYLKDQAPEKAAHKVSRADTICPACRKVRDRMPGGILKITGDFVRFHQEEIMNLIRNETNKAQTVNPLERIMALGPIANGIEITTTNEKLAQRIGRALHKAYSGHVEYKWSEDTKLVRVNWHRQS